MMWLGSGAGELVGERHAHPELPQGGDKGKISLALSNRIRGVVLRLLREVMGPVARIPTAGVEQRFALERRQFLIHPEDRNRSPGRTTAPAQKRPHAPYEA